MKIPATLSRWRKFWLGLTLLAFIAVAILSVGYVLTRRASLRDLELALAETDKVDPYWRLEDLEAHRRPLPSNENGYEQVMAAVRVMPTKPWPQPVFPQFDNDRPYQLRVIEAMRKGLQYYGRLLNEEEARVLRTELKRADSSITILRRMVEFSSGRGPSIMPIPGSIAPPSPPYIKVLEAAHMLFPDARLRIHDGDISGALHDVRAILHMSRALENEPVLMAQLARRAIDGTALRILERILADGSATESDLAAVQHELEAEAASPMLFRGFQGERAFTDHVLEDLQTGALSLSEFRRQLAPGTSQGSISAQFLETVRIILSCFRLPSERARMLRRNNALITIGQLPAPERLAALQEFRARAENQATPNSAATELIFGAPHFYSKYLDDEVEQDARLACAIIAVVAERFRLANQRWPQNLEELSPTYLKAVPLDPFSGQPMKLARTGTAFIVYSIGSAHKEYEEKPGPVSQGPPLGSILYDPAQRRRPAPPFVFPERTVTDSKKAKP